MNQQLVLLHLSLIEGIGPAVINSIIQGCTEYTELLNIYTYSTLQLSAQFNLSARQAHLVAQGLLDTSLLERECLLLQKNPAIQFITIIDEAYPQILKNIHLPPPILYIQGTLSVSEKSIAIIGSRQADSYASRCIKMMIPDLVAQDWHIISGGALGADTMAHEATLVHNGITSAIIGSGLLQLYPGSNRKLFNAIIAKGGAVISPFSLMTQPLPGNFPARNRIIAGLAQGCLVVQAAQKSGASITAQFALEQGKEVFAIPGSIDHPLSAGCHELIRNGAHIATSAEDIFKVFGYEPVNFKPVEKEFIAEPEPLPIQRILTVCTVASSFDHLLSETNLGQLELQEMLFNLQLEGKINQNFMGLWQTNNC